MALRPALSNGLPFSGFRSEMVICSVEYPLIQTLASRHGGFQWLGFVKARGVPNKLSLGRHQELPLIVKRYAQGTYLDRASIVPLIFKKEYIDEQK
jgi:hypothetical protein